MVAQSEGTRPQDRPVGLLGRFLRLFATAGVTFRGYRVVPSTTTERVRRESPAQSR
ncbi:hypothetical protein SAMN04489727_8917 [Amycolatopsis tolypomycina]|uniref:Uncharacterized protein n=1 Tax=Amycolatopsis tolypomycina TaxID=208445 RepID=A0A1H5CR32_9PSEU|nr:hypothetical protein SAMN04489727_8917 [Amycolatopsis tolypomycina]